MYSFNDILERLKGAIITKESLIEGTFTATNLRAVAQEFNLAYAHMDYIQGNYALSSAQGAFLDARAMDYGIDRRGATAATGEVTVYGKDGVQVASGSIFAGLSQRYVAVSSGVISGGEARVKVKAVEPGVAGNAPIGSVSHMENAPEGVTAVSNTAEILGGSDLESDEMLRARIFEKIRKPATSGNVYHYEQWATSVPGVGRVKVFPLWKGPGTVKASILGADGHKATEELIDRVQRYIDPTGGRGEGQAPVGAIVTVATATEVPLNISAEVEYSGGGSEETARKEVLKALKDYLINTAYDGKTKRISPAQVGYVMMGTFGVVNYHDLKLNGSASSDVVIGDEDVATLGTLTLNGVQVGDA